MTTRIRTATSTEDFTRGKKRRAFARKVGDYRGQRITMIFSTKRTMAPMTQKCTSQRQAGQAPIMARTTSDSLRCQPATEIIPRNTNTYPS